MSWKGLDMTEAVPFWLFVVGMLVAAPLVYAQEPTECGVGWRIAPGYACGWEGERGYIRVDLASATTIQVDINVDGKPWEGNYPDLHRTIHQVDTSHVHDARRIDTNGRVVGGVRRGYRVGFVNNRTLTVDVMRLRTVSTLRVRYDLSGALVVEALADLNSR